MTSGLQRGSNLPANVPKTMVIPEERGPDFDRKMKSPLFSEHFQNDGWTLVYFNALREAFTKTKAGTVLEALFGQRKNRPSRESGLEANEGQKLMEFGGSEAPEPPGE
jgi:hypothetical protein